MSNVSTVLAHHEQHGIAWATNNQASLCEDVATKYMLPHSPIVLPANVASMVSSGLVQPIHEFLSLRYAKLPVVFQRYSPLSCRSKIALQL